MVEGVFYNLLFAVPIILPVALGHGSIANMYIYILFIDFMNGWGHSNFEFIPSAVFDMLPPLKYLVYSPT
jgi:aldehyde decarbonylase